MSFTKPPTIEARVAMINGNVDLTPEAKQATHDVTSIIAEAADKILAATKDVTKDQGTLVRAIQKLQASKDVACQAFILPLYAPKEQAPST